MDKDAFKVGYYAVCLLDILGQKKHLRELDELPIEDSEEFVGKLKQTVGVIEGYRGVFEKFFSQGKTVDFESIARRGYEALLSSQGPESLLCLDAGLARARRLDNAPLSVQQFSDTFIFYSPLLTEAGDISPVSVFSMLLASAAAVIIGLATGHPMRGAIHIGRGVELAENNFYGPALAEAYRLENEIAQYPRILISDEAIEFIQSSERLSADDAVNQCMQGLRSLCCPYLHQDDDGRYMVDFLGDAVLSMLANNERMTQGVHEAHRFAIKERERFRLEGQGTEHPAQKEKMTLTERYDALLDYMSSRLPNWPADPGASREEFDEALSRVPDSPPDDGDEA